MAKPKTFYIAVLKQLICLLPETDQQVMELYYFHDLTQQEIAVLINVTHKSVEHRLARARNLVKAIINQLGDLLSLLPVETKTITERYLLDRFSHEKIAELVGCLPKPLRIV